MLAHFSDGPVNLSEYLRRNGFREVDACHLCTKSWSKLLDLDMVKFGLSGMRHDANRFARARERNFMKIKTQCSNCSLIYLRRLMKWRVWR